MGAREDSNFLPLPCQGSSSPETACELRALHCTMLRATAPRPQKAAGIRERFLGKDTVYPSFPDNVHFRTRHSLPAKMVRPITELCICFMIRKEPELFVITRCILGFKLRALLIPAMRMRESAMMDSAHSRPQRRTCSVLPVIVCSVLVFIPMAYGQIETATLSLPENPIQLQPEQSRIFLKIDPYKNKTWFFFSYEGFRITDASSTAVPPATVSIVRIDAASTIP
jgi:hypothetical protein